MLIPKSITCSALQVSKEICLYHTGPSLDKGPMPGIFYFALSGEDSLCLDPFNQVVQFLTEYPVRVFSLTLPGHEADLPAEDALNVWAEDIRKGVNIFSEFSQMAIEAINFTVEENFVNDDQIALAGLSRGGFLASHVAAKDPRARFILLFAPLTVLGNAKEFQEMRDHPIVQSSNLLQIAESICDRHIRIYIGNRDQRVDTRSAFDLLEKLSEAAFQSKIRSAQIEMMISPSIGHLGHGTAPHIFKSGSDWLIECLLKI